MITDPIQADDIRYNPASTCFEAKVTVHGAGPARVYACEIQGDLSLDLSDIEAGLRAEALRRHMSHQGLYSSQERAELRPMYTTKAAQPDRGWFASLPVIAQLRAA